MEWSAKSSGGSNWSIYPATEYRRFADAWRAINDRASGLPALDPAYIGPLLEELGSGREILAVYSRSGEPSAMGLFVSYRFSTWETFTAGGCPCGAWVALPTLALQPVMDVLIHALPGFAASVSLTRQDPYLADRPRDQGRINTLDYYDTPTITVSSDFESFVETRPRKKFRQNLRTGRDRLRRDGIVAHLETISDPAAMETAVAEYGHMESAGWKQKSGNNVHPDNAQGRFFRRMMQEMARQGKATVYRFIYNDKPVAIDLCIHSAETVIILRTTYDEQEKKTAPAVQLHREIFKRIFDQGCFKRIEFYGEAQAWHKDWTDEIRTTYHANFYRWSIWARLHQFRRGRNW